MTTTTRSTSARGRFAGAETSRPVSPTRSVPEALDVVRPAASSAFSEWRRCLLRRRRRARRRRDRRRAGPRGARALSPSACCRPTAPGLACADRRWGGGPPRARSSTSRSRRARGVSTGISAEDRALTIRVACDPSTGPRDIAKPGHVTPLRCHEGTTLEARTLVDAAVDLVRLAGLRPAAAVCTVLAEHGEPLAGAAFTATAASSASRSSTIDEVVPRASSADADRQRERQGGGDRAGRARAGTGARPPADRHDAVRAASGRCRRRRELAPIGPDLFREVLGSVCTPVSVVTTMHDGEGHATTVSAFCSLSIDPPLSSSRWIAAPTS